MRGRMDRGRSCVRLQNLLPSKSMHGSAEQAHSHEHLQFGDAQAIRPGCAVLVLRGAVNATGFTVVDHWVRPAEIGALLGP
jgi:hypothetical protein